MTLIRSNPRFKTERARFFSERFNQGEISLEAIERIFRQVDLLCNAINEKTGNNIDAEEMYGMVIGLMNAGEGGPVNAGERDPANTADRGTANADRAAAALAAVDIAGLCRDMEDLFLTYPPALYDGDTLPALEALRTAAGPSVSFSLLSNTAFVKGRTLRKALPGLGLDGWFDFALYSDEAGMSKPNPALFRLMLDTVAVNRGGIDPADVLHVGDNPVADIAGASAAGIDGWLVNSNNRPLGSLTLKRL